MVPVQIEAAGAGLAVDAIRIEAPARLHFGFLDLEGGLGRRFASLGLAIDAFATELMVAPSPREQIFGPEAARVRALLARLRAHWQVPPVTVRLIRAIPAHAGLGSGTQLALALGRAVAELFGITADAATIARLAGRGQRSGIGVGAFESGGFLLDGGRSDTADGPPPIIARLPFPSAWRLILIRDRQAAGLAGAAERQAFARLGRFPPERAAHLCRIALMRVLPGVASADFAAVAAGIGELQEIVGAWFAPVQGGRPFTSAAVGEVAAWLKAQGYQGLGQSSWGPTAFLLLPDAVAAQTLLKELKRRFCPRWPQLQMVLTQGRNRGAQLVTSDRPSALPTAP